jgi:hypothetical protein
MNVEAPKPNDERVDSFVGCAKLLLALASSFALLAWIYVGFWLVVYNGIPGNFFDVSYLFYPFIYLAASIYCCWFNIPRRALYVTSVLLNIPLVAISLYWTLENGTFFLLTVSILFFVLWALLCIARKYHDTSAA